MGVAAPSSREERDWMIGMRVPTFWDNHNCLFSGIGNEMIVHCKIGVFK